MSAADDNKLIAQARGDAVHLADNVAFQRLGPRRVEIAGYQVLRELHRGAQGTVLLARQVDTDRQVAIKLMHPPGAGDRSAARRFAREARALARIDHPNVVTVHAAGLVGDCPYLVMPYVSGQPLDTFLEEQPLRARLQVLQEVVGAVHAAHVKGIIHRDLKPTNIRVDEHGRPFVLDFGLAKLLREEWQEDSASVTTLTGAFVGSLRWTSPEQAAGQAVAVDTRSDVYSLGVLLYHAVTGAYPYPLDQGLRENLDTIAQARVRPPRQVVPELDDDLQTIILTCLQREPARRYQSAAELQRDLQNYLDGNPIEAKRNNGWYMFQQLTRRHRAVASGTLIFFLVLLGMAVLLMLAYRRAEMERMRALDAEHQARAMAAQAHEAAMRAEQRAAETETVAAFLQEMLVEIDPQQQAREAQLRETVNAASLQLSQQNNLPPEVQARLRTTLAETYLNLGEFGPAAAQYQAALDVTLADLAVRDEAWQATVNAFRQDTAAGRALNAAIAAAPADQLAPITAHAIGMGAALKQAEQRSLDQAAIRKLMQAVRTLEKAEAQRCRHLLQVGWGQPHKDGDP